MVKGISRQVIVVQSPDRTLFEQAIFILRDDAADVTDEQLLKEARRLARQPDKPHRKPLLYGPVWACAGAAATALAWLLSSIL